MVVVVIQACNNISSKRVRGGCGASNNNLSLDCQCDTASCRTDCSSTLSSLFCRAYIAHWILSRESVVQTSSWLVEWMMLVANQASCDCSSSQSITWLTLHGILNRWGSCWYRHYNDEGWMSLEWKFRIRTRRYIYRICVISFVLDNIGDTGLPSLHLPCGYYITYDSLWTVYIYLPSFFTLLLFATVTSSGGNIFRLERSVPVAWMLSSRSLWKRCILLKKYRL